MKSITLGNLAVWHYPSGLRPQKPRARILLIHGLSEHSERHLNTVNFLVGAGYEVTRFDLRGSGHSGGKRQWVNHFTDYVEDTSAVFNWIQRELEPLPLVVLGHSMGGAIAIYFAASYHKALKGLILSAPAYLVGSGISPLKIAVGQLLVKLVPTIRIPKSTDGSAISRDPKVVEAYEKDPLSYHYNTLKQGDEILKALPQIPKLAAEISVPTLIAHGTGDRIISLVGSYEILRALGSRDKELFIAPHCYHEIHNEPLEDRQNYFNHLALWLDSKL